MIRYAIPTYKRSALLGTLTLGYLRSCGIDNDQIDVFVSNHEELIDYLQVFPELDFINADVANVRDKFNFIHSYYPPDTNVVVLEDDLNSIKKLIGYNKLEVELNLTNECTKAFDLMLEKQVFLCGINSNSNPFFMKQDTISEGFKFVVANMYLFIQTNPPVLITQHSKTDYERTILYFERFGKLLRLDYLCPITKNYTIPGGMQEIKAQREQVEEDSVNYLTKKYPHLCKPNINKKSMYAEMSLTQMKHPPEKKSLFAQTLFDDLTK